MIRGQCPVKPQNHRKTEVVKGSENLSEDANIDANVYH